MDEFVFRIFLVIGVIALLIYGFLRTPRSALFLRLNFVLLLIGGTVLAAWDWSRGYAPLWAKVLFLFAGACLSICSLARDEDGQRTRFIFWWHNVMALNPFRRPSAP